MNDTTQEPPDPPKDLPQDEAALPDADPDKTDEEQVLSQDTVPDGVEYLGDGYGTLDDYFRSELAEHIAPPILWILKHLDMTAVRDRFEADHYRYFCESGCVYRVVLPEV